LDDRVARCIPNVYDGRFDPIKVEEWNRKMEKIFVVVELPEEKKVNIETFYLIKLLEELST